MTGLGRASDRRQHPIGTRLPQSSARLRYNLSKVKSLAFFLPLLLFVARLCVADESFNTVRVPDLNGKQARAVLTFSDDHKAIEIQPVKREPVSIPYANIDKCVYQFTKKHRVSEGSLATAPIGVGAVLMFTKSKSHWLEIDYHEASAFKVYVVRMDKRSYLRVLDALKNHTGIDAEVLGNAEKR